MLQRGVFDRICAACKRGHRSVGKRVQTGATLMSFKYNGTLCRLSKFNQCKRMAHGNEYLLNDPDIQGVRQLNSSKNDPVERGLP